MPNICSVCAWRATCQKKFSVSGRDARCSDFSEDVSLKKAGEPKEKPEEKRKETKKDEGGQK